MNLGSGKHAMHAFETVEVGDNLPFRSIENNELIGIHVRDVQPAAQRIEALIIEPNRGSRHWDVSDLFERSSPALDILRVAQSRPCKEEHRQAADEPSRNSRRRFHCRPRLLVQSTTQNHRVTYFGFFSISRIRTVRPLLYTNSILSVAP